MHFNIPHSRILIVFVCAFFVYITSADCTAFQDDQQKGGSSVLDNKPEATPEEEAKPAQPEPKKPLAPEDEKFEAIVKKCNASMREHFQRVQSAAPADRAKIENEENPVNKLASEFLALAAQHPGSDAAYNSVSFLVVNGTGKIKSDAMKRLFKEYRDDPRIVKNLTAITTGPPTSETEKILSQLARDSKNKTVRGRTMRTHIAYLRSMIQIKQLADEKPEFASQIGKDVIEFMKKHEFDDLKNRESELLNKLANDFADVPSDRHGKSLADIAKEELFVEKNLSVGSEAPNIIGHNLESKKMQLSDFRGKVVLLVFWGHWSRGSQLMYPQLRSLTKKLDGKPFQIVGVNTDTSQRRIASTMKHLKLDWQNFWQMGNKGKHTTEWQVNSWPSLFVIDQDGIIRHKNITGKKLDEALTKMMSELGHEVDLSDHSDGELAAPTPKAKDPKAKDERPGGSEDAQSDKNDQQ